MPKPADEQSRGGRPRDPREGAGALGPARETSRGPQEPGDPPPNEELLAGPLVLELDCLAACSVEGPDAADFLQRIQSRDVEATPPGSGGPACFLDGKGRIEDLVWLHRPEAECFVLTGERSAQAARLERLERYHFGERLTIRPLELAWIGFVPPEAGAPEGRFGAAGDDSGLRLAIASLARPLELRGLPADSARALVAEAAARGRSVAGPRAYEALRILGGYPSLTREAAGAFPPELGLGAAYSLEKGCYVGQEVLARIQTYGKVNRRLVRLRAPWTEPSPPLLFDEELEAGRLTSWFRLGERLVGLALVPRLVLDEGLVLRLGGPSGPEVELEPAGREAPAAD